MNPLKNQVQKDRLEIQNILSGEDTRKLIIVGPCSAWPSEAVLDYAKKLKPLRESLSLKLKIVLRSYTQKPRTTVGWFGPLVQANPFQKQDLESSIQSTRALLTQLVEDGWALADEALFLDLSPRVQDLLAWIAIGARSTEDQAHRVFASSLQMPVGLKNPTSGSVRIGVNSVIAARQSHFAPLNGQLIQTQGNPFAHLVLRGGSGKPNHHRLSELENLAFLVDASHENSQKNPLAQIQVVTEVLESLKTHPQLQKTFKGFMIESFLKTGSQSLNHLDESTVDREGLSITDPCLGWEETEALLNLIAKA